MIFTWPSVPPSYFVVYQEKIRMIFDRLANCPEIKVQGLPVDAVLPSDHFFDYYYHLNAKGRARITEQILNIRFRNGI